MAKTDRMLAGLAAVFGLVWLGLVARAFVVPETEALATARAHMGQLALILGLIALIPRSKTEQPLQKRSLLIAAGIALGVGGLCLALGQPWHIWVPLLLMAAAMAWTNWRQ